MSNACRICISPYREELKRAWNAHFPRKTLWEKYNPLIWTGKQITFGSFNHMVAMHLKDHTPPDTVIIQSGSIVKRTTEGVAKMLTELYSRKLEGMKPEDVSGKDYYQANKLVLEEQKLSLDKNAQMLEFAKIFGIPEPMERVIDVTKKEEEPHAELGPPKDGGDKQKDS